jgi:hypothetical protein
MTTPKAFRDVPVKIRTNALSVTHMVKFIPNTTRTGFDHKQIYLVVGCIITENYEFLCECCVYIYQTDTVAVKFDKHHCNILRKFSKPNQLQTTDKETYTKLQHLEQNW